MKTVLAFLSCIVLAVSAQAGITIFYTGLNGSALPDEVTMNPGDTQWFELHVEATSDTPIDYAQIRIFEQNDGYVSLTDIVLDPNLWEYPLTEANAMQFAIFGGFDRVLK